MASGEERARRNVACVNCRDSKVRCKTEQSSGQACQRCARLKISCVFDKRHKRVTRRSKLEQLERELESIKQAVDPQSRSSVGHSPQPLQQAGRAASPASRGASGPTLAQAKQFSSLASKPRMLGQQLVSGCDIDWYFGKFLECYHGLMPVLRKKAPNECFDANPTLFWTVVYVACRRYARDSALLSALVEHLGAHMWTVAAAPALSLEAIHTLVLLGTWPLPSIRFMTDPTPTLACLSLNAAKLLGCHTGRGSHPHFALGPRQPFAASDEQVSSTWMACCVLAQRAARSSGTPPPAIQFGDTGPSRALQSYAWAGLVAVYKTQRFLNHW
ncbi:hypothetical protein CDD82_7649 [Ophiocordyceps australis]|uniref:Zn(2)-C6 fungal-type domain-containing protein n=1 Tax=Ophiocordyceps australis TaxID=1399860 RepID=A0A2C5YRS4_9HYPO|nr:hypothetical protein CDD82_7649 [Ophiocordyceps australis]